MNIERRLQQVGQAIEQAQTDDASIPEVDNIIDFAVDILGIDLYPAQALILKLAVGAVDLLTDDDRALLESWCAGFDTVDDGHWVGTRGTTPDIIERAQLVSDRGRWGFRRIVLVLGRRAGKTQISAVLVLWLIWRVLMLGDPQPKLNIAKGKTMAVMLYSTNRSSAVRDIFGDVKRLVEDSPAFAPFLDRPSRHRVALFTPEQLASGDRAKGRSGSIVIEAAATTAGSARGPAVLAVVVDEAAFLDGMGTTASTEELLRQAIPAMAQFKKVSLTLVVSSPATKTGKFYELYEQACEIDELSNEAKNPDTMTVQLASWDTYEGWERAHTMEMTPGGRRYTGGRPPIISEDSDEVLDALHNDPVGYESEYRGQWGSVLHPFFPPHAIAACFAEFRGHKLEKQHAGTMGHRYFMHLDPSATRANTAVAIGHTETHDGAEHLLVDYIDVWRPDQFPNHTIDYRVVVPQIVELAQAFNVDTITLDAYNGHLLEQLLTTELTKVGMRTSVQVMKANHGEKPARYDRLLSLALQNQVHLPDYELTRRELYAIEQVGTKIGAPTSGPCQTDDTVDALTWLAQQALDPGASIPDRFRRLSTSTGRSLFPTNEHAQAFEDVHRHRGGSDGRNGGRPRWR